MDERRKKPLWPWIVATVVGSSVLYAGSVLLGSGGSSFLWGAAALALIAAAEIAIAIVWH